MNREEEEEEGERREEEGGVSKNWNKKKEDYCLVTKKVGQFKK